MMYEDWSARYITESNFNMMSERYPAKQEELDEKIADLKSAIETTAQSTEKAEKWIKLIEQYRNITEYIAVRNIQCLQRCNLSGLVLISDRYTDISIVHFLFPYGKAEAVE